MAYDLPTWVNGGPPTRNSTNLNKYTTAINGAGGLDERVEDLETNNAQAQDLANATDPTKGAALIGYEGRTVRVELGDTFVNVKRGASGAKGDNSTDDTAAIQAKIDALTSGQILYFPRGTYRITGELTFPATNNPLTLSGGPNLAGAAILQMTNNTRILKMGLQNTTNWTLEGLSLGWATQQTSSDTNAIGLYFTDPAANSNGAYHGLIQNCMFSNGYRGIAIDSTASFRHPVWDTHIDRCRFNDMIGAGVSLVYPGAAGQPNVSITRSFFHNYNTTNVEPQIRLTQVTQMRLQSLDMEGSKLAVIELDQCYGSLRDIHIEKLNLSGANPYVIYFINQGMYDVETINCQNWDTAASSYTRILRSNSTARVNFKGINVHDIRRPGGNTQPCFVIDGGSGVWVQTGENRLSNATFAITHFDPAWSSAVQSAFKQLAENKYSQTTLSAGTTIRHAAPIVEVNQTTTVTSTAAPTIADGRDGQEIRLVNVGTNAFTLQDQGTLASSNLRLTATTVAVGPRQSIRLRYSSAIGDWVQDGPLVAVL